jgi:hypothetical protein
MTRICTRCGHAVLPGQAYLVANGSHVACPNEREVEVAERWGRWPL